MEFGLFLFVLYLSCVNSVEYCQRVEKGDQYCTPDDFCPYVPPTVTDNPYEMKIKFPKDGMLNRYLFPSTYDKGWSCTHSWNKLYGKSRCNHFHHQDSDRFVWRRVLDCVQNDGTYVLGEDLGCDKLDYVEVAAYSYDEGKKPYEHQGVLLKIFEMKLIVDEWHDFKIFVDGKKVIYEIRNSSGVEEKQEIDIHECKDPSGYQLNLYFGGQCPSPCNITSCFEKLSVPPNNGGKKKGNGGVVAAVVISIVMGCCTCLLISGIIIATIVFVVVYVMYKGPVKEKEEEYFQFQKM